MKFGSLLIGVVAVGSISCASIPRDAGSSEVQRSLAQRGAPAVEWREDPLPSDDPRVAEFLSDELTADEAVSIAMMNSPRLQVALAELGIARAGLIEASTISNPLFEIEVRFPGEPRRPYELRIAQTLIDLVQLPRRRGLGRVEFEAAQMRAGSAVLQFIGEVRSAYYELLAATQHLALTRTIAEAAQTAAEVALRQHSAENITDLDLENEQALYEQAKLDLTTAEQNALVAREALMSAMGLRRSNAEFRLPSDFPRLPSLQAEQEQLQQLAAAERLDVLIARQELEVARRQVPIARLSLLEDTEVDFHYEREPSGETTSGPGIEFPIPIFNTGRAARLRAESEFFRARHALAALEAESPSQLRAARASVAAARARVEYYRDVLLPRRARIVELTKLEHNAMLVGVFQLLQARQNELEARRDFIDAQREYWTARSNLERALQGVPDDTSFMPATGQGQGKQADITRGDH